MPLPCRVARTVRTFGSLTVDGLIETSKGPPYHGCVEGIGNEVKPIECIRDFSTMADISHREQWYLSKQGHSPDGLSESALRRRIQEHLHRLGFSRKDDGRLAPGVLSKQRIRDLHASSREARIRADRAFLERVGTTALKSFASGKEIEPRSVAPQLVEVKANTPEADVFRFATLLWSVPVSRGFGRRMRFLVRDRHNGKLIGVFALGDPVFNLSARDEWIGWSAKDREQRLIYVMDAYVVGAVPPYSQLIGGKLVAALMRSTEVRELYKRKYHGQVSVIANIAKRPRLVLITTTSALGRSSIYNRLVIPGTLQCTRVGSTRGFGHFHLDGEIFDLLRDYLRDKGHPYVSAHLFGQGPNWRMRVVRAALDDLGLWSADLLKHGVEREVYAMPLADNWCKVLLGHNTRIRYRTLSSGEIAEYCLKRWIIPRSERDGRFQQFAPSSLMHALMNGGPPSSW